MPKNLKRSIYEEEQEQYDERSQRYVEAQTEEGEFYQLVKNRKVISWVMIVCGVLCFLGILKHFVFMPEIKTKQQIAEEARIAQQSQAAQQAQQQAEKARAEEQAKQEQQAQQAKEEEEKELKELQSGFKPFDGTTDPTNNVIVDPLNTMNNGVTAPIPTNPMMNPNMTTNPLNNGTPIIDNPPIIETPPVIETPPPVVETPSYEPPSYESHNTNNGNYSESKASKTHRGKPNEFGYYDPMQNNSSGSSYKPSTDAKEDYKVKGFAESGGQTYCYISHFGNVSRVTEGDTVGEMTVQQIGPNYVVLADENGETRMINQ